MKNLFYKILSIISIIKSARRFGEREANAVKHITVNDDYMSFGFEYNKKNILYWCRSSIFITHREADAITYTIEPSLQDRQHNLLTQANDNKISEILNESNIDK
jgi:uncharacterized membrane protein YkgB